MFKGQPHVYPIEPKFWGTHFILVCTTSSANTIGLNPIIRKKSCKLVSICYKCSERYLPLYLFDSLQKLCGAKIHRGLRTFFVYILKKIHENEPFVDLFLTQCWGTYF